MRSSALLCPLSLPLLLTLSLPALAQFQAPTPDELKMTSDPKAPGAAAVYLYREETTDDKLHYHSFYERIKVLTEKGKELATVRIPYDRTEDRITDIQGRTIHADGTIVPLTVKPTDLVDTKGKGFQINQIVFTLPAVEVGSILEYRLNLRYPDEGVIPPTWWIQQPYYVHKAHYSFKPENMGSHTITDSKGNNLNQLMYSWRWDSPAKVEYNQLSGIYKLDIEDIPPTPDEDWMPPINGLRWKVEFYYTWATNGGEYWMKAGKEWAHDTSAFLDVNGAIRQAAGSIVSPSDSETDKAKKIYVAVQKLNNTSFTRKRSEAERKKEKLREIKHAADVWNQGAGSSDEIALLYVALARAAGLKAYPLQVVNRSRAILDPDYLWIGQVDDYLAIVVADGKEIFLDPGQKMCPFGQLHWKHTVAGGIRLTDKDPAFSRSGGIDYKKSSLQRVADLTVDEQGAVKGVVRVIMTGPEALRWRQETIENDQDEVKKRFNEWMNQALPDGVQAEFDHFLGLDDYESNLMATVKVSGNLGAATGKRYFLPGLFFAAHAKHPFVAEEKRVVAIDVHYPLIEQDQVTYHLPDSVNVESMPQPASLSMAGAAMFKIAPVASGHDVTVERTLAYSFSLLDAKQYGPLHDFYQKVAQADQEQLVLTRASQDATAKGN